MPYTQEHAGLQATPLKYFPVAFTPRGRALPAATQN
jgi:hypothetical protein